MLILAGGGGSGKGFAYDMAIDFDGKKLAGMEELFFLQKEYHGVK